MLGGDNREPDVAIWSGVGWGGGGGMRRLEYIEDGESYEPREIEVDILACNNTTNPRVIIEFNWTSDWQSEFLKLKEQYAFDVYCFTPEEVPTSEDPTPHLVDRVGHEEDSGKAI